MQDLLSRIHLPPEAREIVEQSNVIIPRDRKHLFELAFRGSKEDTIDVTYDIPGKKPYTEAILTRCKNGIAVNFTDPYMRRRDPDAMLIADDLPTDKEHFEKRYKKNFSEVREETFTWLKEYKDLILLPIYSGLKKDGYASALLAPANAAFFAATLADLQGVIPADEIPTHFPVMAMLYLAPPFRHTHFGGKQLVVHNRSEELHELFCYNLYPGPSAKKGIYSVLLNIGEREGWTTLHSSSVLLKTPYDNEFVILHEGASGGGKSEMTEPLQRNEQGTITLAKSTLSSANYTIDLRDTCSLHPVADDMALAHPKMFVGKRKLVICDAEAGWFLRVDHLNEYGKAPQLEKLCINPPEPLIFLNIEAQQKATALLWDHIEDAPNKPCTNPRVIVPREFIQNIVKEPVTVDIRSFGVRTPPCTRKKPDYGILGLLHILPPALAWLWRLVAPRGYGNPSIVTSNKLASEGVGSYWPFATGKRITQANILLQQIQQTLDTGFVLIPNQHVGCYHVGFNGEWIAREYLARRGNSTFDPKRLIEARCPLLGYVMPKLSVNGQDIPDILLSVEKQDQVGPEGYDAGAKILQNFFMEELATYRSNTLHPVGRTIIDICMNNGSVQDYHNVMPS